MNISVMIVGYPVNVIVESYSPAIPAKLSGPYEEGIPEVYAEVEFTVDTGNLLLDTLIEKSDEYVEAIKNQLLEKLKGLHE